MLCLTLGCLLGCFKRRNRHFYTAEDGMAQANSASDGAPNGRIRHSHTVADGIAQTNPASDGATKGNSDDPPSVPSTSTGKTASGKAGQDNVKNSRPLYRTFCRIRL